MGKLLYSDLTYRIIGLIANFKKDKLQIKRLILPDKYLKSV